MYTITVLEDDKQYAHFTLPTLEPATVTAAMREVDFGFSHKRAMEIIADLSEEQARGMLESFLTARLLSVKE